MFQVQGYQGYQPLHQGYQPYNQGYQPSNQLYNQGYQPLNQGYQAKNYDSYQPTQSVCQRDDLQLSNEVSQFNHSDDLPLLNQNQINNFEEPYFCDDVVELTRLLIENLEHNLIPRSGGNVLTWFHKGNDQINFGYTDHGLHKQDSKDAINFDELGTQLAYIYRFFTSHVLIVGELLLCSSGWFGVSFGPREFPVVCDFASVNSFLDTLVDRPVNVTCFGGGPVSEVAAITCWLRGEGLIYQDFRFQVLDKYETWRHVAEDVARYCDVSLSYDKLDFLSAHPSMLKEVVKSSDIVCMSKFLSALTAHTQAADKSLVLVLRHMRPGSMLVFADNSGGGTTQWVTRTAAREGLLEVFAVPRYSGQVHRDCHQSNERRGYFGVKATDSLKFAVKLFLKPGNIEYNNGCYSSREKQYHRVGCSKTSM